MARHEYHPARRRLLLWIVGGGLLGPVSFPRMIQLALAMGVKNYPQGVQLLEGDVRINGIPATMGSPVKSGDSIITGGDGKAIVVMHRSVYLLRENTRLTLSVEPDKSAKEKIVSKLMLFSGKVLSVFGRGKRRLETKTAVIGVRGTAVYMESDPVKSYICTCYGRAEIISRYNPKIREKVRTIYHESPRFVFGPGAEDIIVKAPVFNHTDTELIMLEKLVGRIPPFMRHKRSSRNDDESGGNGGNGGY